MAAVDPVLRRINVVAVSRAITQPYTLYYD